MLVLVQFAHAEPNFLLAVQESGGRESCRCCA